MEEKKTDYKKKASDTIGKIMDTEDSSKNFTEKEITSGKGMAILSYIIPLIPYFAEKENNYVKYHAKRGMDLFIVAVAYSIIYNILYSVVKVKTSCGTFWGYDLGNYCETTPWWVTIPLMLVGLVISIIAIIGIVNVVQGKAKELPVISKIKIFNK